jgi:iron complex transport system permease protein
MRLIRNPYLINSLLLVLALLLSVAIGAVVIPLGDLARLLAGIFSPSVGEVSQGFAVILYRIRIPHTLLVALSGAALAGSGAAYQGLFRNPLADPYLIGVASGAGLGAVLAMVLPFSAHFLGMFTVPASAFLGALLTVTLVYMLARSGRFVPTATLILAGVAVGSFASALTSFLMLRSPEGLQRAFNWLLGGYSGGGWQPVGHRLPAGQDRR